MDKGGVPVSHLDVVVARIGGPSAVHAELPTLRYDWACRCSVIFDGVQREWYRCVTHRMQPRPREAR
jgi:hypothetical protein